jgi:hypothetical protein
MYKHLDYFRLISVTLKEFIHDPHQTVLHRVRSIASLEEFLFNSRVVKKVPHLIVMDRTDSRLQDALSDNRLVKSFYSFYVVMHASMDDSEAIEGANTLVNEILFKILSRMLHDKQYYQSGLQGLDMDSVVISSVGPIGDNFIGVECSFVISEQAPLAFNLKDWDV